MPYPDVPFALAPPRFPTVDDFLAGYVPMSTAPAPTPGSTMGPGIGAEVAPTRSLPGWDQLRALGAGMATPFGFAPPPMEAIQPVPTLAGTEVTPSLVRGADLGAAAAGDPEYAEIGRMVGFGPAFRAAGALASSRPVQALGQTLARPAVGVPLALSGSLLATSGEAQAPVTAPPDPEEQARSTRADISKLTAEQETLTTSQSALQDRERVFRDRFGRVGPGSSQADIRALQEFLASPDGFGVYGRNSQGRVVRPDGNWGDGTRLAVEAFLQRLQQQRQEGSARLGEINTQLGTLQTLRRSYESTAAADAADRALTPFQRAVQQYAPYVGAGLGLASAGARRFLLRRGTEQAERAAAAETNLLLQQGGADTPLRVGGVNRFVTEGGGQAPFAISPQAPFFTPSTPQAGVTGIYPPRSSWMRGADWATVGGATAGAGLGWERREQARADLEAALADFRADPSRVNADRVAAARTAVSAWTGALSAGATALTMYPMSAGVMRYRPTRPDVQQAEAEIMRLNSLARGGGGSGGGRSLTDRRYDRGFSLPPDAPPTPGEPERWVSDAGQRMIEFNPNAERWVDENGHFTTGPRGRRKWRRISSIEEGGDSAVG